MIPTASIDLIKTTAYSGAYGTLGMEVGACAIEKGEAIAQVIYLLTSNSENLRMNPNTLIHTSRKRRTYMTNIQQFLSFPHVAVVIVVF